MRLLPQHPFIFLMVSLIHILSANAQSASRCSIGLGDHLALQGSTYCFTKIAVMIYQWDKDTKNYLSLRLVRFFLFFVSLASVETSSTSMMFSMVLPCPLTLTLPIDISVVGGRFFNIAFWVTNIPQAKPSIKAATNRQINETLIIQIFQNMDTTSSIHF